MSKRFVLPFLIAGLAFSQKIQTEASDPAKVIRVQTTPNHLSIIELKEPVTEVAAGSSSFKIEWRGNKVFVQPLEPDAATNLFIWTASGRLNYELVPAPSIEVTHFAIDHQPPPALTATTAVQTQESAEAERHQRLASDLLFASRPVILAGERKPPSRVEVTLKDVLKQDGRVYVRYAIQNSAGIPYQTGAPVVVALRAPISRRSLYSLRDRQVVGNLASTIRSSGEVRLKLVDAGVQALTVPPGTSTYGLVCFESPQSNTAPVVIRLAFPPDAAGEVAATLIL